MFSHHEIVTQAGLLQTVTTSWCAFAAIATGRPKDAALSAKVLCSAFGIFFNSCWSVLRASCAAAWCCLGTGCFLIQASIAFGVQVVDAAVLNGRVVLVPGRLSMLVWSLKCLDCACCVCCRLACGLLVVGECCVVWCCQHCAL